MRWEWLRWGSYPVLPGHPSSPSPNTQNSVGSEKALRVRGVKKGGKERGRNRKVVMINVLGHNFEP